jgi:uncharacterized secreted protein with C-terminal beta-propeller domain
MFDRRSLLVATIGLATCLAVGCGDDDSSGAKTSQPPNPTPGTVSVDPRTNVSVIDNGFESDDPNANQSSSGGGGTGAAESAGSSSSGGSSSGSSGTTNAPAADNSANRAIEEADIVQLDGTLLYALSQYGGLAVVDTSDPNHLRLLGRQRTDGLPFEMYVKNGRANVMMNDYGHWVDDDQGGRWVETSELITYDVSNPAAITEVGRTDVPGEISDSRLVGDTLYLVTYQDGYCWNCANLPSTIVSSFATTTPGIPKVDQIEFHASNNSYSWWRRSVSATNQRLYIGGPQWDWDGADYDRSSIIQVVDISDVAGHLKHTADVKIAGQITNRWQMDEYNGYLRVVSQFGNGWYWENGNLNPVVQTFNIADSSTFTLAGQTQLSMPSPETLSSVRFDGPRGYAITSQYTDPLYTIDLSNPATPKQMATLQMPGSIFYMEPHGDRLVGFGYDSATWNGNLAVSLFDVTDLTKPALLSRVSFGAGWGSIDGNDIDRIQKAVRVLDDAQTILVPFSSYGLWNNDTCEEPQSGIQIIDYTKAGLTKRGVAPHHGQPRRAMLLPNNKLLGMSDRNVSTFDLTSRDNPAKINELDLSNPAYRMVETPTHIASITDDWWSGEPMLSLTPKANADDANAVGKLSLAGLATPSQTYCTSPYAWASWYDARLFASGTTVWMTIPVYEYSADYQTSTGRVVVATIDTSNPAAPRIIGQTSIPLSRQSWGYGYWGYEGGCAIGTDGYGYYSYGGLNGAIIGSGDAFVQVGNKLAYLEEVTDFVDENGNLWNGYNNGDPNQYLRYHWRYRRILHVVDLTNPTAPVHEAPVALPDSNGATPLLVMDNTVLSSRWVKSTTPGKVRFYVDRVSLAGTTTQLSSINVPGSLLQVDAPSHRIATADYRALTIPATDWSDCYNKGGYNSYFDDTNKSCRTIYRDFKLADFSDTKVSVLNTWTPPSQNIGGVQLADDRIYVTHYPVYGQSVYDPNKPYQAPPVIDQGGLWALGGLREGNLVLASNFVGDAQWPLAASGTKVAVYMDSGLAIYDTATFSPALVSEAKLRGYGYSSYLLMSPDHALASLGEWGLQTIRY